MVTRTPHAKGDIRVSITAPVVTDVTAPELLGMSSRQFRDAVIVDKLEQFLAKHSKSEDLGLRLDGEQLAVGVRFVRMAKEGAYDLVVGNPPYLALAKTDSLGYVAREYPRGKADLFAAFLERSLELARPAGMTSLVAMRAWMFLNQYAEHRRRLLHECDLRALGDLDRGAFESMPTSQLISVAMAVVRASSPSANAVALQPTAPGEKYWGSDRTPLKRAAILAQRGRYTFDPRGFGVIEGEPLVYWWSAATIRDYAEQPKLRTESPTREGVGTRNDVRYLRRPWEVAHEKIWLARFNDDTRSRYARRWVPFIKGAGGRSWFEPVEFVVNWWGNGIEVGTFSRSRYGRGATYYFRPGIAFTDTGAVFAARLHRYRSVFGDRGHLRSLPTWQVSCAC